MPNPFVFISPATRGISLALTRYYLHKTTMPIYATHRSPSPETIRRTILDGVNDIEESRLHLIPLELTSEASISEAAHALQNSLPQDSYLHTCFLTGGVLHAEKQPADLDANTLSHVFQINVISHLLLIKYMSRFLPLAKSHGGDTPLSKWVHMSARVGSISDNMKGGWYSYRSSKAALNQVIKTFDRQLEMRRIKAICVGIHPGTVKTDLSKAYWDSVEKTKLFEPDFAAKSIAGVVKSLSLEQRGRVWDWKGDEIPP